MSSDVGPVLQLFWNKWEVCNSVSMDGFSTNFTEGSEKAFYSHSPKFQQSAWFLPNDLHYGLFEFPKTAQSEEENPDFV